MADEPRKDTKRGVCGSVRVIACFWNIGVIAHIKLANIKSAAALFLDNSKKGVIKPFLVEFICSK